MRVQRGGFRWKVVTAQIAPKEILSVTPWVEEARVRIGIVGNLLEEASLKIAPVCRPPPPPSTPPRGEVSSGQPKPRRRHEAERHPARGLDWALSTFKVSFNRINQDPQRGNGARKAGVEPVAATHAPPSRAAAPEPKVYLGQYQGQPGSAAGSDRSTTRPYV